MLKAGDAIAYGDFHLIKNLFAPSSVEHVVYIVTISAAWLVFACRKITLQKQGLF
jgi:hypothetical protein